MPGYDGKGPIGRGLNGRGLGPCGQGNVDMRRRFFGFGRRRGWGGYGFRWFSQPVVDEHEELKAERNWLKQQLDAVNRRISEIDKA
jgi:hypothetical protein